MKARRSNEHFKPVLSLKQIETAILKKLGLNISNLEVDLESEEYVGHNFNLNVSNIKLRKAKITPKKNGQFVTLWKRNEKEEFGFFIFPKTILNEKHILTNASKTGKRGFRVYAEWDFPKSKQAEKTKSWQMNFFINLVTDKKNSLEKFIAIFQQN